MINKSILEGYLTEKGELKNTSSGMSVCSFKLAVPRNYLGKDGNELPPDEVDVVVWKENAENVANNCNVGDLISVEGRLQVRFYINKLNQKIKVVEVIGENINILASNPIAEQPECDEVEDFGEFPPEFDDEADV